MRNLYHEVNVQIFRCKNESYLVEQEMAVQIVTFYQNENIIYTAFAYKTMYIKCMVRIFLKKDIKREWYWELLLVSIGLFLLHSFKNMPILKSLKVRIEGITITFIFYIVLYIIILEWTIKNTPWDFNAKKYQHVTLLRSAGVP